MPRFIDLANVQQFTAINLLSDPGHIGGPVVIPNCMQVVLNWQLDDGKIGHNVLYGRTPGVPAPTTAIADAIKSALVAGAPWTALASYMTTGQGLLGVSLRSVHSANQPIVSGSQALIAGTSVAIAMPNEVAVCITMRTALTGISNRGRFFIPCWAGNSQAAGNVVAGPTISAIQTWVSQLIAIFAASGLTLVIGQPARNAYTGISGTFHPVRAAGSVPVTSLLPRDNHWDSQRRRGLK